MVCMQTSGLVRCRVQAWRSETVFLVDTCAGRLLGGSSSPVT